MASRLLFEALGLGAYYLLVSLAAFDAVLLLRRDVEPALAAGRRLAALAGGRDHAGRPGRARAFARDR